MTKSQLAVVSPPEAADTKSTSAASVMLWIDDNKTDNVPMASDVLNAGLVKPEPLEDGDAVKPLGLVISEVFSRSSVSDTNSLSVKAESHQDDSDSVSVKAELDGTDSLSVKAESQDDLDSISVKADSENDTDSLFVKDESQGDSDCIYVTAESPDDSDAVSVKDESEDDSGCVYVKSESPYHSDSVSVKDESQDEFILPIKKTKWHDATSDQDSVSINVESPDDLQLQVNQVIKQVFSTVATDVLVLKHQAISSHSAEQELEENNEVNDTMPGEHLKIIRRNGQLYYMCKLCPLEFTEIQDATKHKIVHSRRKKPFQCPICSQEFAREAWLTGHMARHPEIQKTVLKEVVECQDCKKTFNSKKLFREHQEVCPLIGSEMFRCRVCGKYLKDKATFRSHLATHGKKLLECPNPKCDYYCTNSCTLYVHRRKQKQCAQAFECSVVKMEKCQHCKKEFKSKELVRDHKRVCPVWTKKCRCCLCGRSLQDKDTLRSHIAAIHGRTLLECPECDYYCTNRTSLSRHNRKHQECEPTPFQCSACGKYFQDKDNLSSHVAIHGRKLLECSECDYHCTSKNTLSRHRKKHKLECPVCEKRFLPSSAQEMREHILSHRKNFSCNVCDFKCHSSGILAEHLKVHTGLKAFACAKCLADLKTAKDLQDHMLQVHGASPQKAQQKFSCGMCGEAYGSASLLMQHLVSHSK